VPKKLHRHAGNLYFCLYSLIPLHDDDSINISMANFQRPSSPLSSEMSVSSGV